MYIHTYICISGGYNILKCVLIFLLISLLLRPEKNANENVLYKSLYAGCYTQTEATYIKLCVQIQYNERKDYTGHP